MGKNDIEPAEVGELLTLVRRRVTMGDVDAAQTVYVARPYAWQEELFTGWLAERGHSTREMLQRGAGTPVASSSADYLRPLALDDVLELELRTQAVGRSSFAVRGDVYRLPERELALRVTAWHVWAEFITGADGARLSIETRPLPAWLREALGQPAVDTMSAPLPAHGGG